MNGGLEALKALEAWRSGGFGGLEALEDWRLWGPGGYAGLESLAAKGPLRL